MTSCLEVGPLLADVLDAEKRADRVLRYPALPTYADAVVAVARRIERPLLMPVGPDGCRLLGAVEVRCEGEFEQFGWQVSAVGRNVLLVAVAGVSGMEIAAGADSARRLGARRVHACAVDLTVNDAVEVDSFTQLEPHHKSKTRRSA